MDTPEGLFFSPQQVTLASEPEEAGATLGSGEPRGEMGLPVCGGTEQGSPLAHRPGGWGV